MSAGVSIPRSQSAKRVHSLDPTPNEQFYEAFLHQGQIKHALKTALACCLATVATHFFHVQSGQLAVVFVYLLMTMGMPRPRLNWLLTQLAIAISAIVSALLLVWFGAAPFFYLTVTLLWIAICLLFTNWFPLPATMGAMVSAIGIFVIFKGTVGATLTFYANYGLNFLIAGFSVLVVYTLVWPLNAPWLFLQRLADVYAHLEARCRRAAGEIRSGEAPATDASRPLRQLVAPGLQHAWHTSNPFNRLILACRSLNLRLWFFNQAIAPVIPATLPAEARRLLASLLDQCGGQLHALLEAALHRRQVPPVDTDLLRDVRSARWSADQTPPAGRDVLLAHGIHQSVLQGVAQDLHTLTTAHNALLTSLRRGLAGELASFRPVATGTRLIDPNFLRSGIKLVLILLLLLVEEGVLGFGGGSQVAFFATFFATTGNLGRQNKTDLIGLAGLLGGFGYGGVAAFFTSRLPQFPLLLALVFLGEFLANLAFQTLPRYGVAGMQAGLALPFAYLAKSGPEWGSLADVRTRFWGLVVAGFTAVVVHAYVWPVLPMRRLSRIATGSQALRARLGKGPRRAWPKRSFTRRICSKTPATCPAPITQTLLTLACLAACRRLMPTSSTCISSLGWRRGTRCRSVCSRRSAIMPSRRRGTWSRLPNNSSSSQAAHLASNRCGGSRMHPAAGSVLPARSARFRMARSMGRYPW